MEEQDIRKILPNGYRCEFAYTGTGKPIFAVDEVEAGNVQGVLKIHNKTIELEPVSSEELVAGGRYAAEGIEFEVIPLPQRRTPHAEQHAPAVGHTASSVWNKASKWVIAAGITARCKRNGSVPGNAKTTGRPPDLSGSNRGDKVDIARM